MTELLPCPFCGGEAKLYSVGTGSPHYGHYHQVVCQGCLTASGAYWSGEQSAIDAWNTRAATTIGKVQVEVAPTVRTCKPVEKDSVMRCSECDYPLGIMSVPAFCAGCGAKVVEQ